MDDTSAQGDDGLPPEDDPAGADEGEPYAPVCSGCIRHMIPMGRNQFVREGCGATSLCS